MSTVRVERCPDCNAMVGEGMLYAHQQREHRQVAPALLRVKQVIALRKEQHREALRGWVEPRGFLVPTEPDADERRRIRDCLYAALTELSLIESAIEQAETSAMVTPERPPASGDQR